MLNFPKQTRRNNVDNINFHNTFITGEITEVQSTGSGKYNVKIACSDKEYPNIYTITSSTSYVVNRRVGILWEKGNRQLPAICGTLRNITFIEVSGSVNSLGS